MIEKLFAGKFFNGSDLWWVKAVPKFQIWYLYPGVSNLVPRVPGGVVRAGASAKAAQSTPLWATLSTGPKKAPWRAIIGPGVP